MRENHCAWCKSHLSIFPLVLYQYRYHDMHILQSHLLHIVNTGCVVGGNQNSFWYNRGNWQWVHLGVDMLLSSINERVITTYLSDENLFYFLFSSWIHMDTCLTLDTKVSDVLTSFRWNILVSYSPGRCLNFTQRGYIVQMCMYNE